MCGIAGFFSKELDGIDRHKKEIIVSKMISVLKHRGPDDDGVWVSESVAFGHSRLAILDLSKNGSQPMHSSSGRFTIVFNGEIYNHLDIRKEISNKYGPRSWKGTSDTETIIESIEVNGLEKTLESIEGMFAFALWDSSKKKLILARDKFGEKPLYYGNNNNIYFFASELKPILSNELLNLSVDEYSINLHQSYGFIPQPRTILNDVFKLAPGSYIEITLDSSKLPAQKFYWSAKKIYKKYNNKFSGSIEDSSMELERLLTESIKRQLISDVPLGAFLSGGIDSSLVVALMSKLVKPKTFSIGFQGDEYDESKHAKKIAEYLQTDHTEFIVSDKDLLDVVPDLQKIYDEPLSDASQIPMVLLSRLSKKHVSVALSGDGADELFGGYNRHISSNKWWWLINKIPFNLRSNTFNFYKDINFLFLQNSTKQINRIQKIAGVFNSRSDDELYYSFLSEGQNSDHLNDQEKNFLSNQDNFFEDMKIAEKLMILDINHYLPDNVLVKVDRAAMSTGLETRAPFLNTNIFNFAASLPIDYKIRGNKGKLLQRQLLEKILPVEMFDRPKQGFEPPLGMWLKGPLKDWASYIIESQSMANRDYHNTDIIKARWDEHLRSKADWSKFLWNVITLESWRIENNI